MECLIDFEPDPSLAPDSPLAEWQSAERQLLGACADSSPSVIADLLEISPFFEPSQQKFRAVSYAPDESESNFFQDDGGEQLLLDIIDDYGVPEECPEEDALETRPEHPVANEEISQQQPPGSVLNYREGSSSIGTYPSLIDLESDDGNLHSGDNETSPTIFSESISRPLSVQLLDSRGCHDDLISVHIGRLRLNINATDYARMVLAAEAVCDTDDDETEDEDYTRHNIKEHPDDCRCDYHGPYLHYDASCTSSAEDLRNAQAPAAISKERMIPSSSSWIAGIKNWIQSKRGRSRAARSRLTKPRKTRIGFHPLESGSDLNLAEEFAEASQETSPATSPEVSPQPSPQISPRASAEDLSRSEVAGIGEVLISFAPDPPTSPGEPILFAPGPPTPPGEPILLAPDPPTHPGELILFAPDPPAPPGESILFAPDPPSPPGESLLFAPDPPTPPGGLILFAPDPPALPGRSILFAPDPPTPSGGSILFAPDPPSPPGGPILFAPDPPSPPGGPILFAPDPPAPPGESILFAPDPPIPPGGPIRFAPDPPTRLEGMELADASVKAVAGYRHPLRRADSPCQRRSAALTIDEHDALDGDDAYLLELLQNAKRLSRRFESDYPPPHTASSEALPPAKLRERDLNASGEPAPQYQCTFCTVRCSDEHDWMEHEKSTHIPYRGWTCTLNPPIEENEYGTSCAFCGDVAEGHSIAQHQVSVCTQKPIEDRTFTTDPDIEHHLQTVHEHKEQITKMMRSWEWPNVMDEWYWNCGFCDMVLQSWERRQEHLADEHFKKGAALSTWSPLRSPYPIHRRMMAPVPGFPSWDPSILITLQQTSQAGAIEQSSDRGKKKRPNCRLCDIAFANFADYNLHMRLWHRAPRTWKCPNLSKVNDLALFFEPIEDSYYENEGDEEDTDEESQLKKRPAPESKHAIANKDYCLCCGLTFSYDLDLKQKHLIDVHHFDIKEQDASYHHSFREEQFFLHLANVHKVDFEYIEYLIPRCEQQGRPPALPRRVRNVLA